MPYRRNSIYRPVITKNNKQNSKTNTVTRKNKKLKPWITADLIDKIKKRDNLHLALREHPDNTQLQYQ